jgi:hypothetical protein
MFKRNFLTWEVFTLAYPKDKEKAWSAFESFRDGTVLPSEVLAVCREELGEELFAQITAPTA